MGMFDEKQYLTGDNGLFNIGDTFTLHEATIIGKTHVNGSDVDEAELVISDAAGTRQTVYTSGRAITGAIKRMSAGDLPANVKLESKDTRNGKAHVLVKAES